MGARIHLNQIREGSEASYESVVDLATGRPLKFEVVTGTQAKADSRAENFSARPPDFPVIRPVSPIKSGAPKRTQIECPRLGSILAYLSGLMN